MEEIWKVQRFVKPWPKLDFVKISHPKCSGLYLKRRDRCGRRQLGGFVSSNQPFLPSQGLVDFHINH